MEAAVVIDDNSMDITWMRRSACADHPADLFFAERGHPSQTTQAKAICATSPVRVACLDYAVVTNQRFGIWGGLTEKQRRPFRREYLIHSDSPALKLAGSQDLNQQGANNG